MVLSGFLFLFILVLNLAMGALGHLMEKMIITQTLTCKRLKKIQQNFKQASY